MKSNNPCKSPKPEITLVFTATPASSSLEHVKQLLIEAYLERVASKNQKEK